MYPARLPTGAGAADWIEGAFQRAAAPIVLLRLARSAAALAIPRFIAFLAGPRPLHGRPELFRSSNCFCEQVSHRSTEGCNGQGQEPGERDG